jgi:hypothetical protein
LRPIVSRTAVIVVRQAHSDTPCVGRT